MWPFRSYKRNQLINAFLIRALDEIPLEDSWSNRLLILESIRLEWEERVADYFGTETSEYREYLRFLKALDEEIAYNLDRCIETSCPR